MGVYELIIYNGGLRYVERSTHRFKVVKPSEGGFTSNLARIENPPRANLSLNFAGIGDPTKAIHSLSIGFRLRAKPLRPPGVVLINGGLRSYKTAF